MNLWFISVLGLRKEERQSQEKCSVDSETAFPASADKKDNGGGGGGGGMYAKFFAIRGTKG